MYIPAIWLSTNLDTNAIEIQVKDNGTGIPVGVTDKIFLPFYNQTHRRRHWTGFVTQL